MTPTITLAVAEGLAKFIAKEMNGKLVTNSTETRAS